MDDRAGKPDAAACGLSVDAEGVDVVLGLTILPYCNVPGLKCVAMGFIRRQTAKRHYTKRLGFIPALPDDRVECTIAVLKMNIS